MERKGTAEEMESQWRRWVAKNISVEVHSQIRRLRAEDSHHGEDIREVLAAANHPNVASSLMICSRRLLPASPLSGKSPVKPAY